MTALGYYPFFFVPYHLSLFHHLVHTCKKIGHAMRSPLSFITYHLLKSSEFIGSFFNHLPIFICFHKRTIFLSLFEKALEAITIFVDLYALSIFQSVNKATFILHTSNGFQSTLSIGTVVFPVTVINIAIALFINSSAITFIVFPASFVHSTIRPGKSTFSVLHAIFEITYIFVTVSMIINPFTGAFT